MNALRALAAGLLALALVLLSAAASSTTVTDASGDSSDALGDYAAHLDIVQTDMGSSSGLVTVTMTLEDLHVSQGASHYSHAFVSGGKEFRPFCTLSGDGTQLTGSCGATLYDLGLQPEEEKLRSLPLLGALLAIVLDLFVWEAAEKATGSQSDVPVTVHHSATADTITWTLSASDLGLAAGDVVELLHGGSSDCTAGCPTADNIFGNGATFTVE